jgi:hypothetical protein
MPEIKTAMPGLFWVAQYAQSCPNRYTLAVLSIQMRHNGTDPKNRRENKPVLTLTAVFQSTHNPWQSRENVLWGRLFRRKSRFCWHFNSRLESRSHH